MTIGLILSTIATSAADSINPVAITQQFVLQGLAKKKHHIWYFIMAIYITNFIFGMLAYYGIITVFSSFFSRFMLIAGRTVYMVLILASIIILLLSVKKIVHALKNKTISDDMEDTSAVENHVKNNIKSVTPPSLFILGVSAATMELTSALPYFAFIGLLLNYKLSFPEVFLIQALYNLIYSSPLIALYLIYCKKQMLFNCAYTFIKVKMERLTAYVVPVLLLAVSGGMLFFSITKLM